MCEREQAFAHEKPLRWSAAARRGRRSPSPVLVGLLELGCELPQHIEHGDDRWRAAALAGSCGRRAPEGLMDSKDLLVLAASVMRSISLIARPRLGTATRIVQSAPAPGSLARSPPIRGAQVHLDAQVVPRRSRCAPRNTPPAARALSDPGCRPVPRPAKFQHSLSSSIRSKAAPSRRCGAQLMTSRARHEQPGYDPGYVTEVGGIRPLWIISE